MVEVVGVWGSCGQARRPTPVDWLVRVVPRSLLMEVAQRKRSLAGTRLAGSLGARIVDGAVSPELDIQGVVRVGGNLPAARE